MSTDTYSSAYQTLPRAPEGWYADPHMANTVRYWDGIRWTGSVVPLPEGKTRGRTFLIVAGYVSAVVLPILGLIIGIVVLATTRRTGHGVSILVITGIAFVLYAALRVLVYTQV